jgi:hypothetical protein
MADGQNALSEAVLNLIVFLSAFFAVIFIPRRVAARYSNETSKLFLPAIIGTVFTFGLPVLFNFGVIHVSHIDWIIGYAALLTSLLWIAFTFNKKPHIVPLFLSALPAFVIIWATLYFE